MVLVCKWLLEFEMVADESKSLLEKDVAEGPKLDDVLEVESSCVVVAVSDVNVVVLVPVNLGARCVGVELGTELGKLLIVTHTAHGINAACRIVAE